MFAAILRLHASVLVDDDPDIFFSPKMKRGDSVTSERFKEINRSLCFRVEPSARLSITTSRPSAI